MNNFNCNKSLPNTPESFKNTVRRTLNNLPDYREDTMRISFNKKVILAVVAIMVVGTTVFATGKITTIVGSSRNKPIYTTLPNIKQVQEDFNMAPKLIDKFSNGYVFNKAYLRNDEGLDNNGVTIDKSKALLFHYKNQEEKVTLVISNKLLGENLISEASVNNYNNIDLNYTLKTYKFVPADYELTEQDKVDELSGKYVFSYGTEQIEINEFKHLSWEENGVYYSLYAMDSKLSQDEFVEMAKEIIDSK